MEAIFLPFVSVSGGKQGRGNVDCLCISIPISNLLSTERQFGCNVFLLLLIDSWAPAAWI